MNVLSNEQVAMVLPSGATSQPDSLLSCPCSVASGSQVLAAQSRAVLSYEEEIRNSPAVFSNRTLDTRLVWAGMVYSMLRFLRSHAV